MMRIKYMFQVVDRFVSGKVCCITVEGDVRLLRNGSQLTDEKGNAFVIETIGMPRYRNIEDLRRYAEIVLCGDVEDMGDSLFLSHG